MSRQHQSKGGSRNMDAPLTAEDIRLCCELLARANQQGLDHNVAAGMREIEEGWTAVDDISSSESLGTVTGSPGTMADSSKRQRGGPTGSPTDFSVAVPSYVNIGEPGINPPSGDSLSLPEGITSLTDWGEYKVAFGKFKHIKTYHEILTGTSEEMVSYRKFVFSHRQSGPPALRDLADYLDAAKTTVVQGPVIPGSNLVRRK